MNSKYKPLALLAAIELVGAVSVGILSIHEEQERTSEIAHEVTMIINDKAAPAIEIAEDAEAYEEETNYEEEIYYEPTYYSYYDPEYDDMSDQDYIAWRESGADYEARNGRYYGKYQMDESRLDGDYSPEHQEEVAEAYMLDRYGSWEDARAFWDEHGWW